MPKIPRIKSNDNRNKKTIFTKFYWDLLYKQQKEAKLKGEPYVKN